MSTDWSRAQDVERLAERGIVLPFDVRPAQFPRLVDLLADDSGFVRGRLDVHKEGRRAIAKVELDAEVPLVCQRCLGVLRHRMQGSARLMLLSEEEAGASENEADVFIVESGRVVLRDVIEDELLLELPLVPRHDEKSECDSQALRSPGITVKDAGEAPGPFAALSQLVRPKE